MATLTEISVFTRKFIIWATVGLAALLILRTLIGITIKIFFTQPLQVSPPNTRFGKIPSPKFSSVQSLSNGLTFKLLNIEGKPPETTAAGKIYSMPKKLPSFLGSQKAKSFSKKLGFEDKPKPISSTYYKYRDSKTRLRTLELDTVNLNFKLKYEYSKNPDLFKKYPFILKEKALSEVKNYININNLFDKSILEGKITTTPLKYNKQEKKLKPASSLSNAHAIRIDFFRNDLDEMKLVPPSFNKSYIYIIYTSLKEIDNGIFEIIYTFWPIDYSNFGTYPLLSSSDAYQALIDGKASVINLGRNDKNNIIIRNIYLSYYDSEDPQIFLQPIFVFEGDNDFVAYLPAVSPEWLE